MANRSFIISVVLLIGAAIVFSGISGNTGKYVNQTDKHRQVCTAQFEECIEEMLQERGDDIASGFTSYNRRMKISRDKCIAELYAC